MAADTAAKRRRMMGLARLSPAQCIPLADGTIAAVDRQHFIGLYGIAGAGGGGGIGNYIRLLLVGVG